VGSPPCHDANNDRVCSVMNYPLCKLLQSDISGTQRGEFPANIHLLLRINSTHNAPQQDGTVTSLLA